MAVEERAHDIRDLDLPRESLPKELDNHVTGNFPADSESSLTLSRGKGQGDQLIKSARAEIGEVREENERLKMYLERVRRDYETLQMQFLDIVKEDDGKQQPADDPGASCAREPKESDLVSLSLGWVSGSSSRQDEKNKLKDHKIADEDCHHEGLALSLDCKFEPAKSGTTSSNLLSNTSPENSFEDHKEGAGEIWPPSKVLKTTRSRDDEASQPNPAKKARVCVRARCDAPTMNDGCQWRKYGQKIAKGNPCPRAYYRCTAAPSCPVRKQVQRCAEDMSILITTYEGTHNHPLPVSATAMASTTSAAASMLLSGSSTSGSGQGPTTTATTNLHGLCFYLSDPLRLKQFNPAPITPPPSHPTITLDLTSTLPRSSSLSPYLSQFSTGTNYYNSTARYRSSSTSLNFSLSEPISSQPISWSNELLNYGATGQQPFNESNLRESFHHYLPFLHKTNNNQQDSIAAATKAITTDPNFQSALAAALKSMISIGGSTAARATGTTLGNHQGSAVGEVFGQKLKWNETFVSSSGSIFGQRAAAQVNPCGSSYENKSGPLMNSPSQPTRSNSISLPFSSSKLNAAATSLGDHRDRNSL